MTLIRLLLCKVLRNQSYRVEIPTQVAFESGPGWQRIVLGDPGNKRISRAFAILFGFFVVCLLVPLLQSMTTGGMDLLIMASLFGINFTLMCFWIWFGSASHRQIIVERHADGALFVCTRLGRRRLNPAAIGIGLFSIGNADTALFASCCSGALVYENGRALFPVLCSSPENASHVLSALASFFGGYAVQEPTEIDAIVARIQYGMFTLNTGTLGMRDPVLCPVE